MKLRLPNFFQEDLPRKFVALFFAILIWFAVDNQLHDFAILHNVPVLLRYDRSAIIVENVAMTVDVTIRGSRKRLQRISSTDLKVRATVPPVPPGIYFYDLRISSGDVMAPPGIRVTELAPDRQQIQVDRIVAKRNVPIRVRFEGNLREGYKRTRFSALPSAVDVSGPSRILKDVHELVTEPVVLDESIAQDFEVDVKLVPIPNVQTNSDVHVVVEIARHSSQQAYRDLTMNILCRANARLTLSEAPPPVSVTLYGPKDTLDALDKLSIRPFVDTTAITGPGRYRRPVQVWIDGAANVTAEYVHPSIVEIVLVPQDNAASPLAPPPGEGKRPGVKPPSPNPPAGAERKSQPGQ